MHSARGFSTWFHCTQHTLYFLVCHRNVCTPKAQLQLELVTLVHLPSVMPAVTDAAVKSIRVIPIMTQEATFYKRCYQAPGKLVAYLASTLLASVFIKTIWGPFAKLAIAAYYYVCSYTEEVRHSGLVSATQIAMSMWQGCCLC